MSGPALSARGLRISFDGRPAAFLDALDLVPGEAAVLLGPNGSGKSTLLRALALLEPPTAGAVLLLGEAATESNRERLRRSVTLALPAPWLFAATALGNVERGLAARGVPAAERRARAAGMLEALGLSHLAGRDGKRLSSGESARVALARALVLDAPVLLLDEPFAHLDPGAVPAARAAAARRLAARAPRLCAALAAAAHARDPARGGGVGAPGG